MGIRFFEETTTFYLENREICYVIHVDESGIVEHRYIGAPIGHEDLSGFWQRGSISFNPHRPGHDVSGVYGAYQSVPSELLFYGSGNYREPTVLAAMPDGDRSAEFLFDSYEIAEEKPRIGGMPSLRGGQTLILKMKDRATGLICKLFYTVYEEGAIARRTEYCNGGAEALTLTRAYSFSLPLPVAEYDAIDLNGAWGRERRIERAPLHYGTFTVDSNRGASSAILNPFLALAEKDCTEDSGRVFGVSLIYSSSWVLKAQRGEDGRVTLTGGINDFDFLWQLNPGEAFETPEVLIVFSDRGIGEMSRRFHDLFRKHLFRPEVTSRPHPIVINNWEATYFDFSEKKLRELVDSVKGTGIDTFVVDDGWFGARKDEMSSMGDWTVNKEKFPSGLEKMIDYVHASGMKFGLWFEPEGISEDSELFRAHPDYAIGSPRRGRCACRHEYLLNLARKEVRDSVVESVNRILRTYPIDYVKWDFNRNLTEYFGSGLTPTEQKGFAHRYALGVYDLFDRIVLANPNVFFEGCSGGGARFDAGVLAYFSQIWTSDDSDAEERTKIQYGTSLVYPPCVMSCHVSAVPNHQSARVTPFATRGDIAHLGSTGYELDTTKLSPEELAQIGEQVKEYRGIERLIREGDLYRTENPFESNFFGFAFVSKDKKEAFLTVSRSLGGVNNELKYLKVKGLCPETTYRAEGSFRGEFSGKTLMNIGLPSAFHPGDFQTMKVRFTAIDTDKE